MWLYLLSSAALVFWYRRQVFLYLANNIIHLYCYIFSVNQGKVLKQRISATRCGEYFVHEYRLYHDTFVHNIKIIHDKEKHELQFEDTISKLDRKTCIVHCNLSSSDDELLFDMTNVFREFFLHFDDDTCLSHFIDYVADQYKTNIVDDYKLTIFVNDEEFTEKSYFIKHIKTKTFKDLLLVNKDE